MITIPSTGSPRSSQASSPIPRPPSRRMTSVARKVVFRTLLAVVTLFVAFVGFLVLAPTSVRLSYITSTTVRGLRAVDVGKIQPVTDADTAVVYICVWKCDYEVLSLAIDTLRARGAWCGDVFVFVAEEQLTQDTVDALPANTQLVGLKDALNLCVKDDMSRPICVKRLKPMIPLMLAKHGYDNVIYLDTDVILARPIFDLIERGAVRALMTPRNGDRADTTGSGVLSPQENVVDVAITGPPRWYMFPDIFCQICTEYNSGVMMFTGLQVATEQTHTKQPRTDGTATTRLGDNDAEAAVIERGRTAELRYPNVLGMAQFDGDVDAELIDNENLAYCLNRWLELLSTGLFECDQMALDEMFHHDSCKGRCLRIVRKLSRFMERYLDQSIFGPMLASNEIFVHFMGIKRDEEWSIVRQYYLDRRDMLLEGARGCPASDPSSRKWRVSVDGDGQLTNMQRHAL